MSQAKTEKLDLRKKLKQLYAPSAKEVVEVEVPEMRFLMIDGEGDPNTSAAYGEAVAALYAVSYALKFAVKEEVGVDYGVVPLEGLYRTDGRQGSFEEMQKDKNAWKWTLMIMQPEWVDGERYERALASVERKKDLPGLRRIRFEALREGRAAQVMHVGPFSEEGPTVERVDRFIKERGGRMRGRHHEIYLSDPRRTAPERLKTVIRHPF
jgi:hypothetical protein